jgi:hypothetical protein
MLPIGKNVDIVLYKGEVRWAWGIPITWGTGNTKNKKAVGLGDGTEGASDECERPNVEE